MIVNHYTLVVHSMWYERQQTKTHVRYVGIFKLIGGLKPHIYILNKYSTLEPLSKSVCFPIKRLTCTVLSTFQKKSDVVQNIVKELYTTRPMLKLKFQ